LLVRGGADIEARHRVDGTTPFIYFLRKGDEYGARLLIDGGADTNATCRYRPDYDMGPIAFAYSQKMWSLLGPLVERSTDAFAGVLEACHLAASTGDKDTIMTLLSMPQITADEELHTTTATCSKYGWGESVDRVWLEGLLARGANINHSIEGKTSLMCAARHSAVQLVPLLIELGADVNAKGRHGWTALHIAATNKFIHPETEHYLKWNNSATQNPQIPTPTTQPLLSQLSLNFKHRFLYRRVI